VHGFIGFSKRERRVIDHFVFQRLRHVRQLAMEYLVYPAAMHSRFEHSMGVMELAGRAFEVVVSKHGKLVEEELERIPGLEKETLSRARQVVRLSALLHDVGHPAFSHAAEKSIPGGDHEKVSLYVIQNVLGEIINGAFFAGATDLMAKILEKSKDTGFLRQFVSGEMDMDRTDYLLRDSKHCGVDYGIFDFRRLIASLTVVVTPDTRLVQRAIARGGEHTFEAHIRARYHMKSAVYFHKMRRMYDDYLGEYMMRA
jgi:HD superfamily phosphohydrolase